MTDYGDSYQQSDNYQNQLHKQCDTLLENIDLKQQRNRQWVAKCYRHLNLLINQSSKTKFNLSNQCRKLPDIATKYAFSIKPYEYDKGLENFTKQVQQGYAGKKKCQMPLVYKSSNNQWQALCIVNGMISIRENNRFNLKIEAQENSTIIITHENNHPLRTKPEGYRYTYFQRALLEITPPSTICVVVIKEQSFTIDGPIGEQRTQIVPFKLPSNPIKIEVKRSNNKQGNLNYLIRGLGDENMMVRPQETFDHGLSSSQGSNVHPYIGIETESRSREY